MSLLDSIDGLANATVIVTRHSIGTYVDGIYVVGATSTFTAAVVMQPAFGLNRVIGGMDMRAEMDNQQTTDVRDFFTRTPIRPRTPNSDPDIITFESADWTVARSEPWTLDDQTYYRVLITKVTHGAS